MDGLIIVYATGGIVASDIESEYLFLQSVNEQIDVLSYQDLTEMLSWAQSEDATIVQTQLVVHENIVLGSR